MIAVNTTACDANSTYYSIINECMPQSLVSLPAFGSAITQTLSCPGGMVSTAAQLEALRYCYTITGSLTITVNEATDYDFTALYDIAIIQGWKRFDDVTQRVVCHLC